MMDCPVVFHQPRRERCEDYELTVFDEDGPVVVQGESCGLHVFTGEIGEIIAGHVYTGNLKNAKVYIDSVMEKIWEVVRGWRNSNDV